jgi:hypothetical protein
MNVEVPASVACPQCNSTNGVPMSDGTRLCLDCRHEWNPATVPRLTVAPATATVAGEVAPSVTPADAPATAAEGAPPGLDDVLGPPAAELAARAAQATLDGLVGTEVVLEGGQRATLVGFPDDDHAEVRLYGDGEHGDVVVVELADVERELAAPPPVADVPTELALALARVNMTVAGLVLTAGVGAVAGDYPNAELVTPPTGWLPLDADSLPAVEQGAAYAVAFLVHAFQIDRATVLAMANTLLTDAQTNEPLEGGNE